MLDDSDAPHHSWALQAAQLWELLRDSQLLCAHVPIQKVCLLTLCVLQAPPAVQQHRARVLAASTADAAAVLQPPQRPYDPTTELLFRDFAELLVRLAALRFPQLGSLEQQVQQCLQCHLLPLAAGASGRQAAAQQPPSLLGCISSSTCSASAG